MSWDLVETAWLEQGLLDCADWDWRAGKGWRQVGILTMCTDKAKAHRIGGSEKVSSLLSQKGEQAVPGEHLIHTECNKELGELLLDRTRLGWCGSSIWRKAWFMWGKFTMHCKLKEVLSNMSYVISCFMHKYLPLEKNPMDSERRNRTVAKQWIPQAFCI